jgi:hypothetical protein
MINSQRQEQKRESRLIREAVNTDLKMYQALVGKRILMEENEGCSVSTGVLSANGFENLKIADYQLYNTSLVSLFNSIGDINRGTNPRDYCFSRDYMEFSSPSIIKNKSKLGSVQSLDDVLGNVSLEQLGFKPEKGDAQ